MALLQTHFAPNFHFSGKQFFVTFGKEKLNCHPQHHHLLHFLRDLPHIFLPPQSIMRFFRREKKEKVFFSALSYRVNVMMHYSKASTSKMLTISDGFFCQQFSQTSNILSYCSPCLKLKSWNPTLGYFHHNLLKYSWWLLAFEPFLFFWKVIILITSNWKVPTLSSL